MDKVKNIYLQVKSEFYKKFLVIREVPLRLKNHLAVPSVITHSHFYDYSSEVLKFIGFEFTFLADAIDWKQKCKLMCMNFFLWANLINVMFYVALTDIEVLLNHENFHLIIHGILSFNLLAMLTVKLSRYFWMKKEVIDLQNSLKEFYPKIDDLTAMKYLRYTKRLRFGYTVTYIFTSSAFALIPIIVYLTYDEVVLPMPLAPSLFDYTRKVLYPFTFIWEMTQIYGGMLIHFGFDLMTITLITTIALEWSTLSQEFSE